MKIIKKTWTLAAAAVLALALAAPVFAQEEQEKTFTLTIHSDDSGHQYQAYQIFSGDLYESTLSNIQWGEGIDGEGFLETLKQDMSQEFSLCEEAADVAEVLADFENNSEKLDQFAAAAGEYLTAASGSGRADENDYVISGLKAGYYLLKDQEDTVPEGGAYTKFILQVVKNGEINAKSDVPSMEKKVLENVSYPQNEGYGPGYNDVADWNIGDRVSFKLIGTIPTMDGYESYQYIFHDTLSQGFTLEEDSIQLYLADEKDADTEDLTPLVLGAEGDYQVEVSSSGDTSTDFDITIPDLKKVAKDAGASYVIAEYSAVLNEHAVIGRQGNRNQAFLEFSNNPNQSGSEDSDTGETPKDQVIVFTYQMETKKVDGDNPETTLKGAEFVLYTLVQENPWYALTDDQGRITGWTQEEEEAARLVTNEQGICCVKGMDQGTYYLKETKAPNGYNRLAEPVEVVVQAQTVYGQNWTGTPEEALTEIEVTADQVPGTGSLEDGKVTITISNFQGAVLPSTGGMGTKIFYASGGILAAGAALILITKKRMDR